MYPTMGTSADNPTATIYGNFKCPYTMEFVNGNLHELIEEYVLTGEMNIRFRQVAYEPNEGNPTHGKGGTFISTSDPRIGCGSLAVWDVSPEDYWSFFFNMFSELVSGTVMAEDLAERMEAAGVSDIDEITTRIKQDRYLDLVKKSTDTARELGVSYTPTFEVAGVIVSPDEHTTSFVESHVSEAVSHVPDSTEGSSESEGSETESKMTITFDGESAQGWAHYECTVSGEFVTNRSTSAEIEDGDAVSGSTCKGGVGQWKDSYTCTGDITDLKLSQPLDIYRNGELVDLDELDAEIGSKTKKLETELKAKQDSTKSKLKSEAKEAGSVAARMCSR
jgi:hypothetical protein